MSLIIFEGLDRTGKSTVAQDLQSKGFELIHQSAPAKGTTPEMFLEEQLHLVSSAANKDIVLDRSYYGELVWPKVYGRESLLTDENLEILKELEQSVGTTKVLMVDPNVEAHWKRCVDNKEPMDKAQFAKARSLFSILVDKHGFVKKTLMDFPELAPGVSLEVKVTSANPTEIVVPQSQLKLTKEQIKLETANAINDVLSKRIIKGKGPIYDQLETSVRGFLNTELGKIFGAKTDAPAQQFSADEVEFLKFFIKNAIQQKVGR